MKGQKFIPWLIVAAALLAYCNSFTGAFLFDDVKSVVENPTIRHLWPIWQALSPPHGGGLTVEGRPLVNLSLAINYALGGTEVWGYHAANLAIHILAGLALYGVVRRTLLQPTLRQRFAGAASGLALAIAVLWTVHPLQTESVTYIAQRAESIMALFYLLTLYCFIRGAESPLVGKSVRDETRTRLWYGLSVGACALGMASKEVMVSAPLMVLLHDRAFLSGKFREAWRRRWPLHLVLASTWILLGFVLAFGQLPATSRNAERAGLGWWQYLATEPGVILHYLRLAVWPQPLCFDYYGWPAARTWLSILPPAVVLVVLLGAIIWAWRTTSATSGTGPAWGFMGMWFFLILAPSSSVIPLDCPAYEHRMYLPLAAVIVLAVLGIHALIGRRSLVVFLAAAVGLGLLTARRNEDYRSKLAIWQDTVLKRPDNPRAQYNLGNALLRAGNTAQAIACYEQALRVNPNYADARHNLGDALFQARRVQEAIGQYKQALLVDPNMAEAHCNLGLIAEQAGKMNDAIQHYEQALRIRPDYPEAHYGLGNALHEVGKMSEAIEHYRQALRLKPDYPEAHYNLAVTLWERGQLEEAIDHYQQALCLEPDYPEAHYNLAVALEQAGRKPEAIGHYEQALRLKPDFTRAQTRLARLRAGQ